MVEHLTIVLTLERSGRWGRLGITHDKSEISKVSLKNAGDQVFASRLQSYLKKDKSHLATSIATNLTVPKGVPLYPGDIFRHGQVVHAKDHIEADPQPFNLLNTWESQKLNKSPFRSLNIHCLSSLLQSDSELIGPVR